MMIEKFFPDSPNFPLPAPALDSKRGRKAPSAFALFYSGQPQRLDGMSDLQQGGRGYRKLPDANG